MSNIEGFKANIEDYLHFSTEAGDKGTKIQDWQDYQKNVNATIQNLIKSCILWQPNMTLSADNVVRSPNMKPGTCARVTKAGTTAGAEPVWGSVGSTIPDGTVTYIMLPRTIDFASQAEVTAGKVDNKIVTPAMLGQTVQVDLASTKRVNLNEADKSVTPGITGILSVAHGGTGLDHLPYTPNVKGSAWDGTHFPAIGSDGAAEVGSILDFHEKSADDADYSLRLSSSDGKLLVNGTDIMKYISDVKSQAGVVAGNVANANAWWVKLGGTIPLIIQGGKFDHQQISDYGITHVYTLPISCSQTVLFATAVSDSKNDDTVIHVQSMAADSVTMSLDRTASNDAEYININLLAIGL